MRDIEDLLNDYRAHAHLRPVPDATPDPDTAVRPPLRARLLSRVALDALPDPEPLITNTLDLRTVALLVGPWGTGKSFIALDWALRVATGQSWQNRRVQHTGRVLYVAAEGGYGLKNRVGAWEYAWRAAVPDDGFMTLPEPVNLMRPLDVAELAALIADEGFRLVIVDTLARSIVGGDENSAKDMGLAVDALYRLREATAAGTVLAVHHTGKDKVTVRGSSALEAGVDTIYQTEGDSRLINLSRTKRKDGPADDELMLRLDPVAESAVVVSTSGWTPLDMSPSEDQLLSTFMSAFAATGASKAELRRAADMPPASFHRALNRLVSDGALVNHGTDQRPFYRRGKTKEG